MSADEAPPASTTHLVVIPSYDTGALVYETVRAARAAWSPVWVVVDGSGDGSADGLRALAAADPGLRVEVLAHNQGKGAAVLHALVTAQAEGFTPCADDGCRRPASGRSDRDVHEGLARRNRTR